MKKIISIGTLLLASVASFAQDNNEPKPLIDADFMRDLMHMSVILIGMYLVSTFFLSIIRTFLDGRLKNRLLDRGTTENVISQLLQPLKKENKQEPFKWFAILAGIGTGLLLINYTQPMGLHSLAIMAFSLAASFLGYYFFSRKTEQ